MVRKAVSDRDLSGLKFGGGEGVGMPVTYPNRRIGKTPIFPYVSKFTVLAGFGLVGRHICSAPLTINHIDQRAGLMTGPVQSQASRFAIPATNE